MPGTGVKRQWLIGAAPDCDLVVDRPTVSAHHCRLSLTQTGFVVEDLDSTNGVYVNGVQIRNPTRVTPNDKVTLGLSVPMPWPSDALASGQAGGDESKQRPKPFFRQLPVSAWALGLLLGLVVGSAVLWTLTTSGQRRTKPEAKGSGKAEQVVSGSSVRSAAQPTQTSVAGARNRNQTSAEEAVFLVLVKDPEEANAFRVGTAFAISDQWLATSATVAMVVRRLADRFPVVTVYSPALDRQFALDCEQLHVDANYERFYTAHREAKEKYDQLYGQAVDLAAELRRLTPASAAAQSADSAPQPVPPKVHELTERLSRLEDQLVESDLEAFTAYERMGYFDVALLRVASRVPVFLSLPAAAPEIHSGDEVVVLGVPFPNTQRRADLAARKQVVRLKCRVSRLARLRLDEAETHRLVLSTERSLYCERAGAAEPAYEFWSGAAVLNREGQVVAVVSRLTVSGQDPSKPPPGNLLDATPGTRLTQLRHVLPR